MQLLFTIPLYLLKWALNRRITVNPVSTKMPMVLRTRKSLAPAKVSEVEVGEGKESEGEENEGEENEEEPQDTEFQDTDPVTPRRSARPHGSTTYEVGILYYSAFPPPLPPLLPPLLLLLNTSAT